MRIDVYDEEGGALLPIAFEFTAAEAGVFRDAYDIAINEGWPGSRDNVPAAAIESAIDKFRQLVEHVESTRKNRIRLDEFPLLSEWYELKKKGDSVRWNFAKALERMLVDQPDWTGPENLRARMEEIERLAPILLDRMRRGPGAEA